MGVAPRVRASLPAVAWMLLCLIWGSTWLFIKLGLEDLPPISFAGIRFLCAASILCGLVAARRRPLPATRGEWRLIATTGIFAFALNYGLLFWGEKRISSSLCAILQTTIPLFGLVIAHVHLPSERITAARLGGVLMGAAGVTLLFSDPWGGGARLAGGIAVVIGAFFVAYSNVLVKARAARIDPTVLAAGQMLFGFPPLLAVGYLTEGSPFDFPWTRLAVVSLLYLVLFGSCAAFLLYYWLMRHMEVTRMMLISLVTPVIAVVLGSVWLGESHGWRVLAGATVVLAGVTLNIRPLPVKTPAAASARPGTP